MKLEGKVQKKRVTRRFLNTKQEPARSDGHRTHENLFSRSDKEHFARPGLQHSHLPPSLLRPGCGRAGSPSRSQRRHNLPLGFLGCPQRGLVPETWGSGPLGAGRDGHNPQRCSPGRGNSQGHHLCPKGENLPSALTESTSQLTPRKKTRILCFHLFLHVQGCCVASAMFGEVPGGQTVLGKRLLNSLLFPELPVFSRQ